MFNVLFAAATHVILVRFSEDEDIMRELVHFEEDVVFRKEVSLACVRRAVWGILLADDTGCLEVRQGVC